jgi:hypothetical protein
MSYFVAIVISRKIIKKFIIFLFVQHHRKQKNMHSELKIFTSSSPDIFNDNSMMHKTMIVQHFRCPHTFLKLTHKM